MKDKKAILFCRAPEFGKVKKRLAEEIGEEKALLIYQHLLGNLLKEFRTSDFRVTIHLEGDPGNMEAISENEIKPQYGKDLGERMRNAILNEFEGFAGSIVLFGADIQGLKKEDVSLAFQKLNSSDLVLGPAMDGGYYLIGMNDPIEKIFDEIPWGGPDVFENTVKKAGSLNLKTSFLDEKRDIDRLEDVLAVPELSEIVGPELGQ